MSIRKAKTKKFKFRQDGGNRLVKNRNRKGMKRFSTGGGGAKIQENMEAFYASVKS